MQRRFTSSNFGIPLQQHRHRAGTLGGFAGTAPGILGDVRADDDGAAVILRQREIPERVLQRVHRAEAGVLDLGHFAVAVHGGQAPGLQPVVQHALDDDRAGGIVGAGFGAQSEKADLLGIDAVLLDQAHGGRAGHGVDALARTAHPEAVPYHGAGLAPRRPGPPAPVLQAHSIGGHIGRESADPDILVHLELLVRFSSRGRFTLAGPTFRDQYRFPSDPIRLSNVEGAESRGCRCTSPFPGVFTVGNLPLYAIVRAPAFVAVRNGSKVT